MSPPFCPIKVIDIDLKDTLTGLESLADYETVQLLVRLHDEPLGYVTIPTQRLQCLDSMISEAILESYTAVIADWLIGHEFTPLISVPSDIHRLIASQK